MTDPQPRGTVSGALLARDRTRGPVANGRPQPMNGVLYFGVLAVAAGIDIATFYQVLALVMKNVPDEVVWLGTVGFTVTALSLAHTTGVRMREPGRRRRPSALQRQRLVLGMIWLFVGVPRLSSGSSRLNRSATGGTTIVEEGQQVTAPVAGSDNPLLAALLFLALYLAAGTVAAIAGTCATTAAAKQYAIDAAHPGAAAKRPRPASPTSPWPSRPRSPWRRSVAAGPRVGGQAQEEWRRTIARRLKQEARLRLAPAAQNPEHHRRLLRSAGRLSRRPRPVCSEPQSVVFQAPISGIPVSGIRPRSAGSIVARPYAG